ncbi:MAG: hypothetical protein P4M08_06445, partial [Oligoflexia bacterium]|nr:hypothetical protein [Oligoflexia bacterium]
MKNWKRVAMSPTAVAASLWSLGLTAGLGCAASAYADSSQITSVNGDYNPNHVTTLSVRPGDMVTLSADLFNQQNGDSADGASVEDFIWQADDSSSDVCDASSTEDCLDHSNFQVTDYGVSFYVPYNIGQQMTISVSSNDSSSDGSVDSIVLVNADYVPSAPPAVAITDPADYNRPDFDPEYAVVSFGNWVYINGFRYWVPNTYFLAAGVEWEPYQNGYWTFSEGYGWTWVSYDPWGWATDHYGIWRFHETYGWVWSPFEDRHYEPNCVTFFNDGDHFGWYPYRRASAYRDGYENGFRDGYDQGDRLAEGYGRPDYRYHPGFSVINNRDFNRENIRDVLLNRTLNENGRRFTENDAIVSQMVGRAYQSHGFNGLPGGERDVNSSRAWMQGRVGGAITETRTDMIRASGGAQIIRPEGVHPIPPAYQEIAKAQQPNRPHPVGSVVNAAENGRPVFMPPTTNGRGIVSAPVAKNPATGAPIALPPRSGRPADPQSGNPVTAGHPVAPRPVGQPRPISGLPGLNPNRPRPSQPAPWQPAPWQPPVYNNPPAPRPEPAPMPRPAPVAPAPAPWQPPVYNNPP